MTRRPDDETANDDSSTYVNTPYGMVTSEGRWYHIPEDDVREYAGEVLDYVSLTRLLRWADAWGHSPRTVTLWTLPPLLWSLSPAEAGLAAVGLFIGWALVSPGLPSVAGARMGVWLGHPLGQGLYYVVVLSALAALERYAAVGLGLVGFVLLRWGLVQWALRPLLRPIWRRFYPLPVTDQVLRGLIVRVAMKYRLAVPQVDAITKDVIENWGQTSDADSPSEAGKDGGER